MNTIEAITSCVRKVTNEDHDISPDLHLVDDSILDSLDSAVFLLELEKHFDIKLDDDLVDSEDLYQVSKLVAYLERCTPG